MDYCLTKKFSWITIFDEHQEGVFCLCNTHEEKFQLQDIVLLLSTFQTQPC